MKAILIENKTGKVKLNEAVTRESIGHMIDEIGRLFGASASAEGADFGEIMNVAENAIDVLEIEINSPGGSVFDGYTIYQEIKSLQDRGVIVNATITGMAASMASVICMACDKVSIVPHGRMMIHDASSGVSGNAAQLRKTADLLDSISADIANIYSNRTGKPVDEIRDLMKKETWMSAETSVMDGFADEITNGKKTSNDVNIAIAQINQTQLDCNNTTKVMFETRNALNAKLASLEAENTELRDENTQLSNRLDEVVDITGTVADLSGKIEAISNEFASAKSEWEAKEASYISDIAQALAKVTPDAIQAAVTEELAKCSHKPIEVSALTEVSTTAKEINREEFNNLSPTQRLAFVKAGGKLK